MGIELVDGAATYEVTHPSGTVFVLKHRTVGMQEEVDRECLVQDGKGKVSYNVSRERQLKIALALADWRGVTLGGAPASCAPETKAKLPVGVILWLVREIDERAGLRMADEDKKTSN